MLENEADSATADGTENENTGGADATESAKGSAASAQSQSAADNTPGADDAAGDAATGRARRASRPAGPPPDVEETRAEPPAAESTPASGDGEAADEPPKRATRTRSRVRTRSGKAAETAEAVPMTGAETSPDAETEPEPKSEPKSPSKAKAKAEAAESAEGAEETSTRRTRTRRRSTTAASTASAAPSTPAVPPVPEVPAVPVAGAAPSTGQVSETEPASGVGIPGVTFQPPMVVFQPPQPTAEPATRPAKSERPERDERDESAERDTGDDEHDDGPSDEDDSDDRPSRRRRRRGGRGRGRGGKEGGEDEAPAEEPKDEQPKEEPAKPARGKREAAKKEAAKKDAKKDKPAKAKESKAEDAEDAEHDGDDEDDESGSGTSRRRRRRRRRSGVDGDGSGGTDDPPNTVVHVRTAREARAAAEDEVQSVRGSTRLEAKKQRRREGREQGRRRPPVITEAEFLARRESVERVMVVRQEGERTQIAVLEDDVLVEHYVNRATHQSYVGNVYLGKVQNVLPSMEAAFVDIGKGRNAVLYAGEVNWDASGLEGQPRRIESALKSGQSVLVQVTKDPLGHKGARLTSQVSLPGRYLVYVPDGSMTGISRKLPDKERSRLKSILKKVMPENAGVIVRTAAEGATEEELSRDVSRLAAQWDNIQKKVKTASAPSLLYGEPDLTIRVVRDIFNEDFSKLVVSGDEAWDTVSDYVQYVAPHLADRVERWTGRQDALSAFRIDEQIAKALDRKVWLPSGGSLVIDRTEAMTVIDVNTGKFTGQGGNLEETVTRNNLEAAEEIVRQLRLRDIGGIVVIDFIDMVLESNRDLVLRRLVECLSRDRTKHQVAEVTSLGLVQMTRKRVGQGLVEAFSETCESCNGRGIHVHLTPVEPKAEKAAGKETGRRRRRKGEVERAVEEKLAEHESSRTPEPEPTPVEVVEVAEPEPVEPVVTRPRRSRPAKRPAGPPPEIDADEPPAQAAVEAAQAADETADTAPGTLDSAEPEPAPDVRPEPVAEPAAEAAEAAAEPEPVSNGAEPPAATSADTASDTASDAGPVHADLTAAESNGTESNGTELNGTAPAEAAAESDDEEEAPGRRRRVRRTRATAPASAEPDVTADTSTD
ncbi:Rne/Rng family ribonuclease [Actinomadura syzygii]|uniref:Rne/Rng family ribonuclease n=1 Tax=Actinomadura syzygii TaxID=1427538 RepID=UPI00361158F4